MSSAGLRVAALLMSVEPVRVLQPPQHSAAILLRSSARLLRMPPRAIIAALSYLHAYSRSEGHAHGGPVWCLVSACLFLASKVEEVTISNNHLLNAVRIMERLCPSGALHASQTARCLDQGDPAFLTLTMRPELEEQLKSSVVLVGQDYYNAKSELLLMEQRLLRVVRFKLDPPQPFSYLLNILHTISASQPLVEASMDVMNDLATFSPCLLDVPPLHLSVAVVEVAAHLAGAHHWLPTSSTNSISSHRRYSSSHAAGSSGCEPMEPRRHSSCREAPHLSTSQGQPGLVAASCIRCEGDVELNYEAGPPSWGCITVHSRRSWSD